MQYKYFSQETYYVVVLINVYKFFDMLSSKKASLPLLSLSGAGRGGS